MTELEMTERVLLEQYAAARRLLEVMPPPHSPAWAAYVRRQYLAFKESGE